MGKPDPNSVAAFVLREDATRATGAGGIEYLALSDLPRQGDTLVKIHYSSLNYKDGLAVTGKGKIVRGEYPFVPGIDLVGEVLESTSGRYEPGDLVIGTGWGIGENHWGGYTQMQWLQADWLVALPRSLTPRKAMVAGTAGLTAMLSIMELTARGREPASGPIVVTGATGGVGSLSVFFLSRMGFEVIASTGKDSEHAYLRALGATSIINRDELSVGAARPLDTARWSGAIDSVGGTTLEALLSATERHGVVAACGLAGGAMFSTSVFPFILRGVSLVGIDSNTCPHQKRVEAWDRIAEHLDDKSADRISEVESLDALPRVCESITAGRVRGRVVIDVNRLNTGASQHTP